MPDEPAGQRLQLKPGQSVALINCPRALRRTLLADVAPVHVIHDPARADAVICFVIRLAEIDEIAGPFIGTARRDAVAWLAYPKGGKMGTDLNRDILGQTLAAKGIKPVRQVAIDDIWSALRFRPI
jgi:hypothetical protein